MPFRFLLFAFVLIGYFAKAQSIENEVAIRDIIESVAENLPDDYDMTELIEVLTRLKKHPINLGKTTQRN